jgi:GNAT superfamily N-acetyltransferase
MPPGSVIIRHATPEETLPIRHFVIASRRDMFSAIPPQFHIPKTQRELARFQEDYLDHANGAFLVARVEGVLIATIGYTAYDHRFPQLDFGSRRVVEVVKLYVDPKWRRAGVASRMFAALEQEAIRAGVEHLYLHTHPFLPGSVRFWERQGFGVLDVDDDPIWRTTHMGKSL